MGQAGAITWSAVAPRFDALQQAALTTGTVEQWLHEWSELSKEMIEQDTQIQRAVSENTADEAAEQRFLTWIEEVIPEWEKAEQALKEKFLALEGFEPPAEMAPMLQRLRAEAALFREENVPLQSELMKLANEYDKTIGALGVEWEGERKTLPQAEVLLQESDRETRQRAWRAILDQYLGEREHLNDLYLRMLRLRRTLARNAGLANFREYQWQLMGRFDYRPEDCFALHEAIELEVVPLATELYEQQRAALGVETLRPWDVLADPTGRPLAPFREGAELEAGSLQIFQQVDPHLAGHFAAMQEGFLDLESRPNKAPGGFCASLPISGKPYIFMNAAGTNDDVFTMLHEGGHAFHFMESKSLPLIWYWQAPMEFCEVASMSMELLGAPYLAREQGGFYSEEEARRAYAQRLRDIVYFLPYMAIVDAFQHWVYVEAPEDVTPEQLDERWSILWDRFTPGVDYGGLETEKATGWHRKWHIFAMPFYYIEYGMAQLGALQVWRNSLRDRPAAVRAYRDALALGGTRDLPSLFEAAGGSFNLNRQTTGELMALIREQLVHLQAPAGTLN